MTGIETVRKYYSCFNHGDWEGMLALLAPEIVHEVNQGEPQHGIDRFRAFMAHMDECYAEQLENIVFMQNEEGNRIACEFTVVGIYKKTDGDLPPAKHQQYILPAGAFLEVSNGKISRVTTYYNLPLWISMVS